MKGARPARRPTGLPRAVGIGAIERSLRVHHRAAGSAIFAAALLIRLFYFMQIRAAPPIAAFQNWAETDMHYFDDWGRDLASGDLLSRQISIPMHRWQRDVAATYLTTHPDEQRALSAAARGAPTDLESLLWARWLHLPQFYQDPLYGYGVGAVYRVFGPDPQLVLAVQLALGALSVFLIWTLSRLFFDSLVGAVAAVLALLCAPLLFYEGLLLRDSIIVCAALAVTWLAATVWQSHRLWPLALLGFAVGLASLLKSTFLLFALAAGLVLVLEPGRSARRIIAYSLGFACALAPLIARNLAVGVPALAFASSGPFNFVTSNEVDYPPDVGLAINPPVLAHFLGDTPATWEDAIATVASMQTATGYAAMLWEKWARAWHWYEIPNNENFYYTRHLIPVLVWLPLTFRWIAPLGIVGIVMALRRLRARWPLFLLLAVSLAPLLGFYVLGRFRATLIAAAIPFAAFTIVEIGRLFRRGRLGRGAVAIAGIVACASWSGQALGPHQVLIRASDWILPYSVLYESRIEEAARAQQWAAGAQAYAEYFNRYEPTSQDIAGAGDPSLAPELARMHRQCAELFDAAGDHASADAQLAAANRLDRLPPRPQVVPHPGCEIREPLFQWISGGTPRTECGRRSGRSSRAIKNGDYRETEPTSGRSGRSAPTGPRSAGEPERLDHRAARAGHRSGHHRRLRTRPGLRTRQLG